MSWVWLNIPLMAIFFLAMAGIPLWLVYRHPDTGASRWRQPRRGATAADWCAGMKTSSH